jgi:ubiquinone/menaquinone biosynthesis C-methylase UbiE
MSQTPHLNYDNIAPEYNQRYDSSPVPERAKVLLDLVQQIKAQRILEAGCGTGFWLELLGARVGIAYGLDYSLGMLEQARERSVPLKLSQGDAVHLPYQNNAIDMIYCVDALHHFGDQRTFIAEAFRVLRPGGALAIMGSDPHSGDDRWYAYDYFEGVRESDLGRFSPTSTILQWMNEVGFEHISSETVEHIQSSYCDQEVLNDPFLKKNATSQLALVSDEAYQVGIKNIKDAITKSEARGEVIVFESVLRIKMLVGFKPT